MPEVTRESLFNELVGALLAKRLGLIPPEPAIVLLTEQFVDAMARELSNRGLHVMPGPAAGSRYLPGLAQWVVGAVPTADELEQMTLIYAFDMAVQNPDRRVGNTNCGMRGGRLLPFDFEMSFSFLLAIGGLSHPCDISKHGISRTHCFRAALNARRASVSWKTFTDLFARLSDANISDVVTSVPDDWQCNSGRVRDHVNAMRKDLARLEIELQRSLT
jgi:hypothetical protein